MVLQGSNGPEAEQEINIGTRNVHLQSLILDSSAATSKSKFHKLLTTFIKYMRSEILKA